MHAFNVTRPYDTYTNIQVYVSCTPRIAHNVTLLYNACLLFNFAFSTLASLKITFAFRPPNIFHVKGPGGAKATDPFKVYLLVTDKDVPSVHALLSYNASSNKEEAISEVPYRRDCSLACLEGKTDSSLKCGH